ncbi:MAG: response regulator transcription factor [Solirubrobacteraceae bacterium]
MHAAEDSRRVLLIEHNRWTANAVVAALDSNGYEWVRCETPRSALANLEKIDIILLNLELPEANGPDFLAELRLASPAAPMLAYSTRQDVDSVVLALQCGADDYLVQPVRPPELLARMKAVSRRASACCPPEQVVRSGDIEIHFNARTVIAGGESVRLTPREFDVLSALARRAGRPVSRKDIMTEVWGRATMSTSRTLDIHMTALRTKLDRPNQLRTVRGFGYRLG